MASVTAWHCERHRTQQPIQTNPQHAGFRQSWSGAHVQTLEVQTRGATAMALHDNRSLPWRIVYTLTMRSTRSISPVVGSRFSSCPPPFTRRVNSMLGFATWGASDVDVMSSFGALWSWPPIKTSGGGTWLCLRVTCRPLATDAQGCVLECVPPCWAR